MANYGSESSLEAWVQNTERRLRQLEEARSTVSIGGWVITADDAGNLIARNPTTGAVKVLAP